MRVKGLPLLIAMALVSNVPAKTGLTPEVLARRAVSPYPSESGPAIGELRNLGPRGLDLLFQVYGEQIIRLSAQSPRQRASDPEWQRLTAALDSVSQQRDSYASRLYWYTDLEQAKAAARASGKPILSLRLLGNLTDEFSCANSRFFRSILYANTTVSAFLRENFVLHWKSVRPAPRVTIDFGDGRKIERTLTGNSIHYVLDSDDRPIDAIPGLYGPAAFLRALDQALSAFHSIERGGRARDASLVAYHQRAGELAWAQFKADISQTGARIDPSSPLTDVTATLNPPDAIQAGRLAMLKSVVETKTLKSISDLAKPLAPSAVEDMTEWQKIAALHAGDSRLDAASIALIRSQYTGADSGDAKLSIIVKNLEHFIAIDTVRNEYRMHARLHQWFVGGAGRHDVEILNNNVYGQLFLTPSSDPWLGLLSPGIYTGLVDDGIVGASKPRQ